MDDIKIFMETREDMEKLMKTIETISMDIKMKFGIDKCKINSMRNGKWDEVHAYSLIKDQAPDTICSMGDDETYKYLGFEQTRGIDHTKAKSDLTTKLKYRLKKILKTGL